MERGERRRGFGDFNKRMKKKKDGGRFIASCESCFFLDEDDECTNPNVTEYDMVYTEERTFCSFWTPTKPEE